MKAVDRVIQRNRVIQRILKLLRSTIYDLGLSQAEIEGRLGWGRAYVSQLLGGTKEMRVEQLFLLLGSIGVDPGVFFWELFQWPEEERRRLHPSPDPEGDPQAAAERDVDRVCRLLEVEFQASGLTQAEVEGRLGWGKGYVSRLFGSGSKRLRLKQVLLVLGALDIPPSTFFGKLFRPEKGPPVQPPWSGDGGRSSEIRWLRAKVVRVAEALVEKGLLSPEDVAVFLTGSGKTPPGGPV